MSLTRLVAGSLAALVLAAMIFLVWPGLDLGVAARFALGGDRFVGQTALGDGVRRVFSVAPFVILALMAGLYAGRWFGGLRVWSPSGAGLAVMALSFALGPGVLVNLVLKDHSHRPRPVQITAFGGADRFRPFYRFDGDCPRNCSFVSGEGSAAFWTMAPALLSPPPVRSAAVAAALIYACATSLLRMAFGGHFLSDSVFAALLTWLVILVCWRVVAGVTGRSPGNPS